MRKAVKETLVPLQKRKNFMRAEGVLALRVSFRKEREISARSTMLPRYLVKCGCCDDELEILPSLLVPNLLGIGGVEGSIENWREILLPILGIKQTKSGLEDLHVSTATKKAERILKHLRKKYANPEASNRH